MIRVSEMGVRFDPDETAEGGASAIVERVFVKKIARGVRRDVVLQCACIEFLLLFGDGDSEQIAAAAFADEPAQTFEPRIFRARDANSDSSPRHRDRPWSCSFATRCTFLAQFCAQT